MNEMTTTMAVPGYQTPFAFRKRDADEEEELREVLRRVNEIAGYTRRDELTTPEALQDFAAFFGPLMRRRRDLAEAAVGSVLIETHDVT